MHLAGSNGRSGTASSRSGLDSFFSAGPPTVLSVVRLMAFVLGAAEGRPQTKRIKDLTSEYFGGLPASPHLLWAVEILLGSTPAMEAAEMLAHPPVDDGALGTLLVGPAMQRRRKATPDPQVQEAARRETHCAALGRSLWLAGVDTEQAVQVLRARISK